MKRTLLMMIGLAATTLAATAQDRTVELPDASLAPQVEIPEGAFETALPNLVVVENAPVATRVLVVGRPSPAPEATITASARKQCRVVVISSDGEHGEEIGRVEKRIVIVRGDSSSIESGLARIPQPYIGFTTSRKPWQREAAQMRIVNGHSVGADAAMEIVTDSMSVAIAGNVVVIRSVDRDAEAPTAIENTEGSKLPAPVISDYSRPEPDVPSAIEARELATAGYSLANAAPNPVSSSASISFTLPRAGHTKLEVYDNAGRVVSTIVDESLDAGSHTRTFDASGIPAGLYLYRLSSGSYAETKTMTVVR